MERIDKILPGVFEQPHCAIPHNKTSHTENAFHASTIVFAAAQRVACFYKAQHNSKFNPACIGVYKLNNPNIVRRPVNTSAVCDLLIYLTAKLPLVKIYTYN
jgi:hypothetical protein